MTESNTPLPVGRRNTLRLFGGIGLAAIVLGLATLGTCAWNRTPGPEPGGDAKDKKTGEPTVGGLPLFAGWPQNQKPDAVFILTGQTFGFLQPCGCSRPQYGGLERRSVFIKSLKDKGWPVAGFDLGDLYPEKSLVPEQALLKYKVTMNVLRELGYVAVGLGKSEFTVGVDKLLAEYALQKEQPPFVLAGNVLGVADKKPIPREQRFPPIDEKSKRALVGLVEVTDVGAVPVGVASVIGKALAQEVMKENPDLAFGENSGKDGTLARSVAALAASPKKPQLNVLLYQGPAGDATQLAKDHPQFNVILCQADDPEPPQFPQKANDGKTLIVQVGHKGKYVGVVGAFKRAGGGFDLKYQLVPLGEEYITPGTEDAARKANLVLPIFEAYSEQVRDRKFLQKVTKTPHPAQIQEPKLNISYVGSERCVNCHQAQAAKWKATPHSHALDTLEKVAKRPGLRNFNGECVQCHVVGLTYKTGYEDQKATPQLAHVGCESCHGPGSGHMSNEKNAALIALQVPWKSNATDRLPDLELIKKIGAIPAIDRGKIELKPEQQRVLNAVAAMCGKCHDHENDPNFDFFVAWPKVNHTFPKK